MIYESVQHIILKVVNIITAVCLSILKDFENASLVLLLPTLGIHDISAKILWN